ncbi:MAG: COX15/CtaA family protein [Armatimonadota bacterium]|nr:COX15/CtaA family protein [Armatimonadota bacterium]MDR5703548.1 COX15/CtaA family protein [Armatimonadota bacterium]MDR7433554.1 COX15/CtaA family protein [Armatimonadota bacterium]
MNRFQRLSVATAIAVYLLIVLGGVVRAMGAGLACPDWPLCHGRLIPPLQGPILVEYFHRLAAAVVSVLVVITAIEAWRRERHHRTIVFLASVAVILLVIQVFLGGFTVLTKLHRALTAAHLATAAALLAVVVLLASLSFRTPAPISGGSRRR